MNILTKQPNSMKSSRKFGIQSQKKGKKKKNEVRETSSKQLATELNKFSLLCLNEKQVK